MPTNILLAPTPMVSFIIYIYILYVIIFFPLCLYIFYEKKHIEKRNIASGKKRAKARERENDAAA
jgi:uncharacterized membrane protein